MVRIQRRVGEKSLRQKRWQKECQKRETQTEKWGGWQWVKMKDSSIRLKNKWWDLSITSRYFLRSAHTTFCLARANEWSDNIIFRIFLSFGHLDSKRYDTMGIIGLFFTKLFWVWVVVNLFSICKLLQYHVLNWVGSRETF